MFSLDRWDVALLAIVGYMAVVTLVRLMARDRDRLVSQLEHEAAVERHRQRAEAKQREQQEGRRRRAA